MKLRRKRLIKLKILSSSCSCNKAGCTAPGITSTDSSYLPAYRLQLFAGPQGSLVHGSNGWRVHVTRLMKLLTKPWIQTDLFINLKHTNFLLILLLYSIYRTHRRSAMFSLFKSFFTKARSYFWPVHCGHFTQKRIKCFIRLRKKVLFNLVVKCALVSMCIRY